MGLFIKIIIALTAIVALTALAMLVFTRTAVFGADSSGARLERITRSPNFRGGVFNNVHPTGVQREGVSFFALMIKFLTNKNKVRPDNPLPSIRTNLSALADDKPTIVWFGHSSYLIKYKGTSVLVDPVFSGHASPVSFINKAFAGADAYHANEMPGIDMLIITHDHYDHLDYETIGKLASKFKHIYTSLGVGAHLERWGIEASKITEFDWWQSETISADITLTATPARHFSGRAFARGKALWSSFVLQIGDAKFFIGGDSGYDDQFKAIGEKFGPFDIALLECGQYDKDWPYIHMFPEQTAQATEDLKAKVLLPVHWAKFVMSLHAWDEPITRLSKAAPFHPFTLTTPHIGEPVVLGTDLPHSAWWQSVQ